MTAYGTPPPTVRRARLATPGELPISIGLLHPTAHRAGDVLSGLRASPRYALAVQVFRSHQRNGAGRCRSCGDKHCRSRGHGATIIAAAGVNLADVDSARCGVRLRRHQRALPVRGHSPKRVKIARVAARRRCGQPHRRAMMATLGLRTSAEKAPLAKARHRGQARSIDQYPLCGRLFCCCGQRFTPSAANMSGREYMSVCGCRLWPIDAATIEQRVYAHVTGGLPASGSSRLLRLVAAALSRVDMRIEIGGTVDDVRIIYRT